MITRTLVTVLWYAYLVISSDVNKNTFEICQSYVEGAVPV